VDFYNIVIKEKKDGSPQIRPDWIVGKSEDLMTRGGSFYAVWDEERGLWSKDIYDVARLVDEDLFRHKAELEKQHGIIYQVATLRENSTKLWDEFVRYIRNSGNNSHNLDETLVFQNTEVTKKTYASRKLPYSLHEGDIDAWDSLVSTLYNEEERAKIEWAIGAVVAGASKTIQKFLVFYGPPGSGKSTILNIIGDLFHGYTAVFDAKDLVGANNSFGTSAFKNNPLVAIQHDGDLSKIVDNTKLNSIVSHEVMSINEKYKTPFEARSNAFLFLGTNVPVKITDAKSGIIRRLIDVVPTGNTVEHDLYHKLMAQVQFELGAIAQHCLEVYISMGENYYSNYRPTEMMLQTDVFYNFVEAYFDVFKREDGVSLKRAWTLYKEYCEETGIEKPLPQYKLREELKNYFYGFEERMRIEGEIVRSYFLGFKHLTPTPPTAEIPNKPSGIYTIELTAKSSLLDELYSAQAAQYAKADGTPEKKWENVSTKLSDLDTSKLHYVKVPESHIVIDFDLRGPDGNKSLELNIEAASEWPATYTETSKGGQGLHLHYIYHGDVTQLASKYADGIEVLTLLGNSSLRRRLTACNSVTLATIDSGLPKKEKSVLSNKSITTEKGLRELIGRNLRKEIHPGTKPSVDFIHKILEEAYESGMSYDVTDMRPVLMTFAAKSTNQADTCIKLVLSMKFNGQDGMPEDDPGEERPLVFFDVEVYPNLFVVCWKAQGDGEVVRMINPEPNEIEELLRQKLVGFNNRRYDNHILYARFLGYSNEELYKLSQKIIAGGNDQRNVMFGEAYNISYADIYDFSSKKQSLKKFQIELNIFHSEMDLPWDQPVPEELWDKVVDYCCNDVVSTEAVFESRKQDFVARQILADISGLPVNHSTQNHAARFIFGANKEPQRSFVYKDLAEDFPGYVYGATKVEGSDKEIWASTYRGEIVGEGGYVYAEPGMYENVVVLDVASMHPASIEALNAFGPYTERFSEIKAARMAIKHKKFDDARQMLDGKLAPYLTDDQDADALAYALKIVINIVYGLTSARFPNPFKDNRNKDNIVAKRGALFMIDLKYAVQERGFKVVHIKTDSIKIPNATPEIIQFINEFGKQYGYDFEHEATYEKFCLVNDAVYVAREGDKWTAVGAQFQHPYVYKSLFSKEKKDFADFCEPRSVMQGVMYLDFSGTGEIDQMVHIGRTGSFVPVCRDGGTLYRVKDGKTYAVTGTKGTLWVTRDVAIQRDKDAELMVDMDYFANLVTKAKETINLYGDYDTFVA
jgi:energy-coupling factor transporter ATP-binding protein EcfA2